MVLTLVEEQVEEEADRVKGEVTLVLFEGLLMVMPASAGSERVRAADDVTIRFLKSFIGFLCDLKAQISPTPTRGLLQSAGRTLICLEWAGLRARRRCTRSYYSATSNRSTRVVGIEDTDTTTWKGRKVRVGVACGFLRGSSSALLSPFAPGLFL